VWVRDADFVYRRCLPEGLDVTDAPTHEPWCVLEMHMRQPDGHVFRIGKGSQ
jgi:hypothetical protein